MRLKKTVKPLFIMYPSRYFYFLLLFLLCGEVSLGQRFSFSLRDNNHKLSGTDIRVRHINLSLPGTFLDDTIVVTSDKWSKMTGNPGGWFSNYKFKSIHDFVRFRIDHYYPYPVNESYTLRLAYTLLGYNNPADTVNSYQTFHDTLTLSYSPDSLGIYQDIQIRQYSGFSKLVLVLNGLYKIDPSGVNPPESVDIINTALLNFEAEGAVVVQPYIKEVDGVSWYGIGSDALLTSSYTEADHYMPVRWNISGKDLHEPVPVFPASYELEWTYIDNYKVDLSNSAHPLSYLSPGSVNYDFKHNSTRVQLDTNYFEIPMVYPSGYVAFRVSMVRPDSVAYRYPVYGRWSAPDSGRYCPKKCVKIRGF